MKVLQINVVFRRGSTGKIVDDIHTMLLNDGYKSVVCYGRKTKYIEKNIYKISTEVEAKLHALLERITGYSYKFSYFATRYLLAVIRKEKPDVVHLHMLNGYFVNVYKLLHFLKKNKIPTVITLHSETMYTGGCGHSYDCEKWKTGCGNCPQLKDASHSLFFDRTSKQWSFMKQAFEAFDYLKIIAVSDWLESRAKRSPILMGKEFCVIGNGIDTENVFYPKPFQELKEKHKLTTEKIVLHVSPSFSSPSKGGHFVMELAKQMANLNIKFIAVGFDGDASVLPDNVIGVKHTKDQIELATYYSMADITLLTSKRETFSMVCVESLACGTPVVGFKAGAPEQIALNDFSEFIAYGDVKSLKASLLKWLEKEKSEFNELHTIAAQDYSRERMYHKYLAVYKSLRN